MSGPFREFIGLVLTVYFLQDTFERAKSWVKELDRQARKDIVIALAGNKFDLSNKRMVEVEVGC